MTGEYERAFHESVTSPERFWGAAAENIQWFKTYNRVLNNENPPFCRWFEGGIVNSCYNALDYHIENGLKDPSCINLRQPGYKNKKTLYLWRSSGSRGTVCRGAENRPGLKRATV